MLVAHRILRRPVIAFGGVALIVLAATAIARSPGHVEVPAGAVQMRMITEMTEWQLFSQPTLTVEVTPLLDFPGGVADVEIVTSFEPNAVETSLLPFGVIGQVFDFNGDVTFQFDTVECHTPPFFVGGRLTDPDTGEILIFAENEVAIQIDKGIGTDDPPCIFEPIPGEEFDPIGGEGCNVSFWKHCAKNDPYDYDDDDEGESGCNFPFPLTPDTLFGAIFEDAFPGKTLGDVLKRNTEGSFALRALGEETVAALLNALASTVDYDLSLAEVITMFDEVVPGSDEEYADLKNIYRAFNKQGGSSLCDVFSVIIPPQRIK